MNVFNESRNAFNTLRLLPRAFTPDVDGCFSSAESSVLLPLVPRPVAPFAVAGTAVRPSTPAAP